MQIDPFLEEISDKIRKGEPVSFIQAVAAINYQGQLRYEREYNRWWRRLFRWIRGGMGDG